MWVRSNCAYTKEDFQIISFALFKYFNDLRNDSEEESRVLKLISKINKEIEF